MEKLINNYGRLIDQLRKDRNLSRQDLCEGIMSLRNFQRFANGEVSISNDKIIRLADRLMVDFAYLQRIYNLKLNDELRRISDALTLVLRWQFDEAKIVLASIDKDKIKSASSLQSYMVVSTLTELKGQTLKNEYLKSKLEQAIDFPNILKKKLLNTAELNALFVLNAYYSKKKDRRIIDYFASILPTDNFLTTGYIIEIKSFLYANIVRSLQSLQEYEECLHYCNEGITYCRDKSFNGAMLNLLAVKSMVLYELGNIDEAKEYAILTYYQLKIENNPEKEKIYIRVLEKNLGLSFKDIINIQ